MLLKYFASKFCKMAKSVVYFWLALLLLVLPLRWICAIVIAAAMHEMGHIFAVKAFGGDIHKFSFNWDGAVLHAHLPHRWQGVLAILAGPCVGSMLVVFGRWFPRIAIVAAAQTIFNLLPIYPLDGGRLIHCLCGNKRAVAWIEYVMIVCLVLAGMYLAFYLRWGLLPVALVFSLICRVFMEKYLAKRRDFEYNSLDHRK